MVLIPAAGSSSRMGSPKQLFPWANSHLIGHCIQNALSLECLDTVVILGAHLDEIKEAISEDKVTVLHHEDWEHGLGSTISFGIKNIRKSHPNVEGVLVLMADQPLMDTLYLDEMISNFRPGMGQIIATRYHLKRNGVPALFDRSFFAELSDLKHDKGAKNLIEKHSDKVIPLDAEGKTADIDTPEDYRKLYEANHRL